MCDFHINKPAAAFGSCDLRSTDVADVLSFPVKTHKTLHTHRMAGALPPPHRCPLFCLIAGLHRVHAVLDRYPPHSPAAASLPGTEHRVTGNVPENNKLIGAANDTTSVSAGGMGRFTVSVFHMEFVVCATCW